MSSERNFPLASVWYPRLGQTGEALPLALDLRIQAALHLDADVAVAVAHEARRLRAQGALHVAFPQVVGLE
jgi:hypothetical protein